MNEEIKSNKEASNNTYKLKSVPKGKKAIGVRWVNKEKKEY